MSLHRKAIARNIDREESIREQQQWTSPKVVACNKYLAKQGYIANTNAHPIIEEYVQSKRDVQATCEYLFDQNMVTRI